jgi:hypothetical protein
MMEIRDKSLLSSHITKLNLRFFGLDNSFNSAVLIYTKSNASSEINNRVNSVMKFCIDNKISFNTGVISVAQRDDLRVALRYDLRKDITFTLALVKTIAYCLMGRLTIPEKYKIGPVPKGLMEIPARNERVIW